MKRNILSLTDSLQPSSTDIALRTAQDSIRNIASRINLTRRVTDRAFLIYKNAHAKKLVRGRSRDIYVATCIYMACREESSTRTMDGKYENVN